MQIIRIITMLLFTIHFCLAVEFVNYTNMDNIHDMATHKDTIWVASTGGVAKLDINGNVLARYTTADGLVNNNVKAVAIDKEGNKWFGCDITPFIRNGVCKFDGREWTTYDTSDGLADNDVNTIAIDNDGNKWFGTFGGGVSKFDGADWTTYDTSDGLAHNRV